MVFANDYQKYQALNLLFPLSCLFFLKISKSPYDFGIISTWLIYTSILIVVVDYGYSITGLTRIKEADKNHHTKLTQYYRIQLVKLLNIVFFALLFILIRGLGFGVNWSPIVFVGAISNVILPIYYLQAIDKLFIIIKFSAIIRVLILLIIVNTNVSNEFGLTMMFLPQGLTFIYLIVFRNEIVFEKFFIARRVLTKIYVEYRSAFSGFINSIVSSGSNSVFLVTAANFLTVSQIGSFYMADRVFRGVALVYYTVLYSNLPGFLGVYNFKRNSYAEFIQRKTHIILTYGILFSILHWIIFFSIKELQAEIWILNYMILSLAYPFIFASTYIYIAGFVAMKKFNINSLIIFSNGVVGSSLIYIIWAAGKEINATYVVLFVEVLAFMAFYGAIKAAKG